MRVPLGSKISVAVCGVLALAVLSSVVAIGSAYRFEAFQKTLVEDNLASVQAAEELEIALLRQRGYVASYILDGGNPVWLERLEKHEDDFDYWLDQARQVARSDEERRILDRLEEVHPAYARQRAEVVRLYDAGQHERAKQTLLSDVAARYEESYELCEQFIVANQQLVDAVTGEVRRQVAQITLIVSVILGITVCLGVALLWLFFRGVIFPLRRIAADVRLAAGDERANTRDDEMRELGRYVKLLMTNVAETRSDLEHSRAQLAHADRLATVGKLAASVAHEIRNPLTAVKMWLYSLRRTLGQQDEALHKFHIISDEIARLESILRNFLEFARPPQLRLLAQPVTPLLENTLELLKHRLLDQQIVVARNDEADLPDVVVDAEQFRQVILNLLINALDALPDGGEVCISCSTARHAGREMVAVRVADSGAGMPEDVRQRIFEPFFSTKEEGTGLGLCIAASIMARHAGVLELESAEIQGTQWTVWIPVGRSSRSGGTLGSSPRPVVESV